MANRFLSNIKINDAYTFPASDGTSGQVITTDGLGNLSFQTISAGSTLPSGTEGDLLIYRLGDWTAGTVIDTIQFSGGTALDAGTLSWNVADGTLDLTQEGTTLQVGQEQHYHVKNSSGASIPDGTAVMATGTDGVSGHILIAPMVADGTVSPKYYLGVTTQTIGNGEFGKVTSFGKVNHINTSAFTDGDVLWVDPANPGGFTATAPSAPNLKIATAFVIASHHINGKIFVRANAGIDLHENHRVQIESPDAYGNPQVDGQTLVWNNTSKYWQNTNVVTASPTTSEFWVDGSIIRIKSSGHSVLFAEDGETTVLGDSQRDRSLRLYSSAARIYSAGGLIDLQASGDVNISGSVNSQAFNWSNSGDQLSIEGTIKSKIYYDYDNTSYYLDPSSTTVSLKVAGSVQVANNSDVASASNVGSLRYREDLAGSYVDMCMKTGAATYAWVNIVQNIF